MTMTAVVPFLYPGMLAHFTGGTGGYGVFLGSLTFDSTTDKLILTCIARQTDTISKIHFRVGTVTTGCTVDVRIESIVNGKNSGSLIAAGANGTVAISGSNQWYTATISTPPSITAFTTAFAVVIQYSSGSAPSIAFNRCGAATSVPYQYGHFPGGIQDTGGGTLTLVSAPYTWMIELGTAGIVHYPGMLPVDSTNTTGTYNNSSSPDEKAIKLVIPVKMRILGMIVAMENPATASDMTFSIWPASSTVDGDALAQATLDGDYGISTTNDGEVSLFFASPPTINAGTTIYAGVRADTANNITIVELLAPAGITNAMNGFFGNITAYKSHRTWTAGSAGAWTDTTTTLPMIALIIDQLDDGAGATIAGTPMLRGMI